MTTRADTEALRRELVRRQRDALLDGELVEERLTVQDGNPPPTADEINRRYVRGEIRIVTEQARYPLDSINSLLESGRYKLDPDYQRRHRWTNTQKSRLIESFIINVPVPPLFLYEYDYNEYEVMDGLQRFTAVREFYTNRFALSGLEYWKELDGYTYSALPQRIKDGINRRYLSSIVLLKETSHGQEDPEQLKRFVFGRINTGGVKLSQQEVRNALYDGKMNQMCKRLSATPALRRLWGIPQNVEELVERNSIEQDLVEDRVDIDLNDTDEVVIPKIWREMTDVELVLRFFANRQRMIAYRESIRDYLDDYLQAANDYSDVVLAELGDLFVSTVELAEDVFGDRAFRRPRGNVWSNVPSVSIYDAVMNVLSRLHDRADDLKRRRGHIQANLLGFYDEHARVFNLRGQTRTDLMTREAEFENFLVGALR